MNLWIKMVVLGILAWIFLTSILLMHVFNNMQIYSPKNTEHTAYFLNAIHTQQWQIRKKGMDTLEKRSLEPSPKWKARWHFSSSRYLIQHLWKGDVSAHMLSKQLQSVMKNYIELNEHQVVFRGERLVKQSGDEVRCQLKRQLRVLTLDGKELPFSSFHWEKLVPQQALEQLYGGPMRTCAVVASSGSIITSFLGKEIDDHDLVLRFNAAPTQGFEDDVGNKTSIRIINSQIMANPMHSFGTNNLYKDIVLVAWDPAPYNLNLVQWYLNPDFNLFTPYEQHRKLHPAQPFYILHPKYIWHMWDIIQGNTDEDIQPNPPSSGFIGIVLMMSLCETVDVYEYIPSERPSDLCHYYESQYDSACTLGAYHPLLYEKMLIQRMNVGSEYDLRKKGKVTLRGFSAMDCGT